MRYHNLSDKLEDVLNMYKHIWKSKASFMSYLRGGIRSGLWMKHPVKLDFIKSNRERIPNPNPRGRVSEVWGGRCNVCKNLFVQSDLQVDHIRAFSASLKDVEDIQTFVEQMALITSRDLQLVCKPCHSIISYAQKQGISFDRAKVYKEHIKIVKDGDTQKELANRGYNEVIGSKSAKNELLLSLMLGEIRDENIS